MNTSEEKIRALKEKVLKLFPVEGLYQTGIKGFSVAVRTAPTFNRHCFYKPMAIMVLQGKKQTVLGREKFTYQENQLVVTSIDIPTVGSIVEASPEKPFIALIVDLDCYLISQLLSEADYPYNELARRGMGITDADETISDAFFRLVCLLEQPDRQKVMAPMMMKEIHYLLLTSSLGDILRSVHVKGTQNNRIANVVAWIKENYLTPFRCGDLAKKFNMAESTFYRHFNQVTSLSPLNYQKQLRLYEAQRLMLSENFSVARAAYASGYGDVGQFTREYKKMFGSTPKKNIKMMKKSN